MRSRAEFEEALRLCRGGLPNSEVAARLGIPRSTVSGWRRGAGSAQQRSRHGSTGPCELDHDFHHVPGDAYAYLLGLYLGDGCISASHRGVFHMRITLDSKYPGIIRSARAALQAVFPLNRAAVYGRRSERCVDVSLHSKHLPCHFPQHGPGRKHDRPIYLSDWQEQLLRGHRRELVRGLVHSDGNRVVATERTKYGGRKSVRYSFSNKSEDIKRIFCESLDLLGIRWTRPSQREIAIYRKVSVALLDEFVGPKA